MKNQKKYYQIVVLVVVVAAGDGVMRWCACTWGVYYQRMHAEAG
jgi:hypothetical protein